jgi:probable HAF family extracellular repeat protein
MLATVAVFSLAAARAPAGYMVTDLGSLDATSSYANGINALGQVVGYRGSSRAFLYSGGRMQDLGTLGGSGAVAWAINDSGEIVGSSAVARTNLSHAFLDVGGRMRDLGTLGGLESWAMGINASGDVVGTSQIPGGFYHAFLYHNGRMQDLGTLGSNYSEAMGINASGQIVGTSFTAGNVPHAFVYDRGRMHDLGGIQNFPYTYGLAINDSGLIVGAGSSSVGGVSFLYSSSEGRVLSVFAPGATALNNSGQILGGGSAIGPGQPFLYSLGMQNVTYLNNLTPPGSPYLWSAAGINDAGQIAGSFGYRGIEHAYLATPFSTPEPGSLTLLAIGALGLLGYSWRRGW